MLSVEIKTFKVKPFKYPLRFRLRLAIAKFLRSISETIDPRWTFNGKNMPETTRDLPDATITDGFLILGEPLTPEAAPSPIVYGELDD